MEVRNSGQGRQTSFELKTNAINSNGQGMQVSNVDNNSVSIDITNGEYHIPVGDKSKISEKDIEKAVNDFNKLLENKATHVEYEVYGKSKDLTVRIVNNHTKEVIKEIPSKKFIDMIDKLCELAGVFVDQKA